MKAVFYMRNGGPEVLEYGDVPNPAVRAGQVIVDVCAASVNAADWKARSGHHGTTPRFPAFLGRDFSGVVSGLGQGVADLKVGDQVFGVVEQVNNECYAEKVAIKASIVAHKPASLSHVEAAAIALTGLTATAAIEQTLKLQPGEKILIQGGAGGVAGFAVQLAKHIGAHVIATASAANHDYVRSLGADEVIDYNAVDFTRVVSDCDAVFDTVGGDVAMRSFAVVKPGGRAAFINGSAPASPRADVVSLKPKVGRDRAHLERIVELVTRGAVRVPEIKVFALRDAADAHRISESRHFRGKLVLKVR
ncbi:MAG TPA: NADP-dependent oxidoreductase [Burkholderiales bacterium]|nr:NADP-dependent oxidoreductase [Burkholderiales bacterium]